MICTAVPREAVDIVWGDISSMLNKAITTSGKRMMEWLPIAMEKLSSFAKDCECSHLEGYGRKAWMKILKKYNWEPEYIAYRMEINNG